MAGLFKVPAPVAEMKRRLKRALSPQPSTSSAPEMTPREYARRQILHSVYEHLHESVRLNDIGQLRGLKSGRRRGRWRRTQLDRLLASDHCGSTASKPRLFDTLFNEGPSFDLGLSMKFGDAMKLMEPLLMDEILTQQSQHTLVSSALDHFATVINHIVDEAEGPSNPPSLRKRTALRRMFQDFEEDQAVILDKEEAEGQSLKDNKEPEEKTRAERVRFETAAAIFALLQEEQSSAIEDIPRSRLPGGRFPGDSFIDDGFSGDY